MSRIVLMDIETLKTFCKGFLGATTFGAYNLYFIGKLDTIRDERERHFEKELEKLQQYNKHLEEQLAKKNSSWFS